MSRVIKFRVWDNEDYMSDPFTLIDLQEGKIKFTSDCVVMQSTGMNDKNEVKIYEDDIVLEQGIKCVVRFDAKEGFISAFPKSNNPLFISSWNWHTMEVIGNIHENPELLEGKE